MADPNLPPLPQNLKAIQHYMKTAIEHDRRDPVIAYYCRLYAMQRGMEIDKKSADCRTYLVTLMDYLEKIKTSMQEEAVHNEVVGQAHVEDYALKVFLFADNEDRASRFNRNVVKSFYTAGMLFDVLTVFGDLSEDIEKSKKYAKWKAAYIHRCLKNGETPIAGPLPEEGDEGIGFEGVNEPGPSTSNYPSSQYPTDTSSLIPPSSGVHAPPSTPQDPPQGLPQDPPQAAYRPPQGPPQDPPQAAYRPPQEPFQPAFTPPQQPNIPEASATWIPPPNPAGVTLTPQQFQKAMKFCKHASSALQYEDSQTAITNLQKALQLLTTGNV